MHRTTSLALALVAVGCSDAPPTALRREPPPAASEAPAPAGSSAPSPQPSSTATPAPSPSASGSASPPATSPPASSPDGGAHAAAAITDGFESPSLDPRWSVLGAEGHQAPTPTTAVIDGVLAHTGARSLHVHDGFAETAAPATSFYLRAFVRFGADPGAGHWMSLVGVGPGDQQGVTEVRVGGHYGILEANFFGNDDEAISDPKGYCSPTCTNGVAPPVAAWACLEVYFGKDELRVWKDDVEIAPLHVTAWRNRAAPWSPVYDRARLGFHDFQGGAVDVWYDDVAIDARRIGCQVP